MSRLGFGWMGSKNGIAKELIAQLPAGEVFVDLFAGGCSITHAAMLSGKWRRFIANDIKGTAVFFKRAIEGRVPNLYEWISRDEFVARRDHDVKVAAAWSFGNNGSQYLWGYDKMDAKLAAFKMLTLPTVEERYAAYKEFVTELEKLQSTQSLGQIESLQRLQSLQALNGIKSVQGTCDPALLSAFACDYRQVSIPDGAVVYADPPYEATYAHGNDYRGAHFDNASFWQWADAQPFPVFVSEYSAPESFAEVWSVQKRSLIGSYKTEKVATERLFVQERFANEFRKQEQSTQPELLEAVS